MEIYNLELRNAHFPNITKQKDVILSDVDSNVDFTKEWKEKTISTRHFISLHEMSGSCGCGPSCKFGNSIPLSISSANLENSETNLKKLATIIWSKTSFSAQLAELKVSLLLI